jgi:hypothetical protein
VSKDGEVANLFTSLVHPGRANRELFKTGSWANSFVSVRSPKSVTCASQNWRQKLGYRSLQLSPDVLKLPPCHIFSFQFLSQVPRVRCDHLRIFTPSKVHQASPLSSSSPASLYDVSNRSHASWGWSYSWIGETDAGKSAVLDHDRNAG